MRVDPVSVALAVNFVPGMHGEVMIALELLRPVSMSSEMGSSSRGGGVMIGSVACSGPSGVV